MIECKKTLGNTTPKKNIATAEPNLSSLTNPDYFFLPNFCSIQPVFILVLFSELLSIVFVLVKYAVIPFPWEALALVSLFIQWVCLATASLWCALRPTLRRLPDRHSAIICFIMIPIITLFFSMLVQYTMPLHQPKVSNFGFDWQKILQNVIVSSIIGGLILRYFYLSGQLEKQRRSELLHRIQALQSRIHPHFLFNSMNTIASLIETDPKTAEGAVEDLADVFRASLNKIQEQVSFEKELDICRRYMNIEQLRLGKRLRIEWSIPETIPEDTSIPLLTVQPLLENAIYHGIGQLPEGGLITVEVLFEHQQVIINIINPIAQQTLRITPLHHNSNNLALENIRNRLLALYGSEATFKAGVEKGFYHVRLSYPQSYTQKA